MTFLAGDQPTAAEINDAIELGKMLVDVTATTDSSAWNSATKVLTNLTGSFTAVAGGKYELCAICTWSCATASNQDALGVVWANGTVVATSTLAGACGPRSHPDGTGFNVTPVYGTFVAAASGTHQVAVIGWKPTGNTGSSHLEGDAAFAINQLTVKRVA